MDSYKMRPFLYVIQPGDNLYLLAQRYNTSVYSIISDNPGINPNCLNAGQVISIHPVYDRYFPTYQENVQVSFKYGKEEVDLIRRIDMIWEEHVIWTRLTIISIAENLSDLEVVTKRLLRNPTDFEIALKPFYGNEIAAEFGRLLKDHLAIAAELVKAAKAGDNIAADNAEKKWYTNANEIATFLGRINPFWTKENWIKMLNEHLALTKAEAVDIITKDYGLSIMVYDEIEKQSLMMAKTMAEGIIRQFQY